MGRDPHPSRRDLMQTTVAAVALAAAGSPFSGIPAGGAMADPQARELGPDRVRGVVYEDRSGAGARQATDPGVSGVLVSNGREVGRTDADGRYSLPVTDGDTIFVIEPSGYAVPLEKGTGLPRFSYIHQPDGTPAALTLLYPGLPPSGPLPASVDFPLVRRAEPDRFDVILLADPQPANQTELDFVRDDIVAALVGSTAAFGITAGDIMSDDLSLYGRYNRMIGQIGLPWWNVGGNHDLNFEASDARYSRETYKRVFGANYYAFEYGNALFLMLDNVDYLGTDPGKPRGNGKYRGRFGERQLAFVANVLKETSRQRLVVAVMHIPLRNDLDPVDPSTNTSDRAEFLALLGDRKAVSFCGHTHTTEHHYFGALDGFFGPVPHHHHVLTAASGSWWSGPTDRRGIACADSRDGSPHGFHVLSIDGDRYTTRYVAANEPNNRQMRICIDTSFQRGRDGFREGGTLLGSRLSKDELAGAALVVNFFDGGPRSELAYRIGAGVMAVMKRERRRDPFVEEVYGRNPRTIKAWVKAEPSSHIWTARLPETLCAGTHLIEVIAVDEYGRTHRDGMILEVTG